jgi:hypothetical protein
LELVNIFDLREALDVRGGVVISWRVDCCLSGQTKIKHSRDRLVLKGHEQKAFFGCAFFFAFGDFVYNDRVFLALKEVVQLLMLLVNLVFLNQ